MPAYPPASGSSRTCGGRRPGRTCAPRLTRLPISRPTSSENCRGGRAHSTSTARRRSYSWWASMARARRRRLGSWPTCSGVKAAARLHTRSDLVEELRKVRRVLQRLDPQAPQEVLAVLDAHVGQNSAQQVKVFQEAIGLTGLAVTKMDGSARAGVVLSIEAELSVPVKLVGIGEGLEDVNRFDPGQYLDALLRMEDAG